MVEIALELPATQIICLSSRTIHRYEIPISQVTMDIFPFIYIFSFHNVRLLTDFIMSNMVVVL
jgi:hypothetical protein